MHEQFPSWICCQLGARRHYETPRALHHSAELACLITDAWVVPGRGLFSVPLPFPLLSKLRQRFHSDLSQSSVSHFTAATIGFELRQELDRLSGWERIVARNCWFQKKAIQLLKSLSIEAPQPTLFSYSYAALDLFRYAKLRGWRTILGQIDPGPVEEKMVWEEHQKHPEYQSKWQPAPSTYWTNWQEECQLADRIIVSSPWSRQALLECGIGADKIDVIPIAYEPPIPQEFTRSYPANFSNQRPLRVLFLGQVILRKGIAALLKAAELLHDAPIEFWLVGSCQIEKPPHLKSHPKIRWFDTVSRHATDRYYQQADIFIFPTLSDGFGITQLEAKAWQLPIVASPFCGQVVRDRIDGLLLNAVNPEEIAQALQFCLNHPQQLEQFSRESRDLRSFSLATLQKSLQKIPYATV